PWLSETGIRNLKESPDVPLADILEHATAYLPDVCSGSSKESLRCTNAFALDRVELSGLAAALLLSRHTARQRNDRLTLVASRLRHYLDRLALLFQSGPDARDEAVRPQASRQDLSRADARLHGVVSLVRVCFRVFW